MLNNYKFVICILDQGHYVKHQNHHFWIRYGNFLYMLSGMHIKSIIVNNLCNGSYFVAHMFARRLIYPGSLAVTQAIMGKSIMRI